MEFEATCIGIVEEHGAIVVGFADNELAPSQYILIQRALEPDKQDRELGHDRIHLEVNDPSKSGYCDLEQAVLSQTRLIVRLTQESTRSFGIDDLIDIRLAVPKEQFAAIKSACRKLFDEQRFRIG